LTFLGTGTSQGVPMIGCDCRICRSPDPRNKRLRTSALIEEDGFTILIDASPDLRSQSLRAGVGRIDAILLTHSHSDHILGIDDLRRFNWIQNQRLPAYGSPATLGRVRQLFSYTIEDNGAVHPYTRLDLFEVRETFRLGPFEITPFNLPHLHGNIRLSVPKRRLAVARLFHRLQGCPGPRARRHPRHSRAGP
jgi:phosphoribosyl 1,2-cyclic phosphate phosphodiesterase